MMDIGNHRKLAATLINLNFKAENYFFLSFNFVKLVSVSQERIGTEARAATELRPDQYMFRSVQEEWTGHRQGWMDIWGGGR